MALLPYATTRCFTMYQDNALAVDYLRFDSTFNHFNITVRPDGWIAWDYTSDVLENYLLDFTIALEAMRGGASLALQFYLVEYEPIAPVLSGGGPTDFARITPVPLTERGIFHAVGTEQSNGGMLYNVRMKLEPQRYIGLPIHIRKTRWFRVMLSYRPPAPCTGNSNTLSGYGIPIQDFQEGMLNSATYVTKRLPFAQMEVIRISSPLAIADLAALQIPSLGDVAQAKEEAIEESHNKLLLDLANPTSDVSEAVIDLVGSGGAGTVFSVNGKTGNVVLNQEDLEITTQVSTEFLQALRVISEDYEIENVGKVVRKSAVNINTLDIGNTLSTSVLLTNTQGVFVNDPTNPANKVITVGDMAQILQEYISYDIATNKIVKND